LDADQLVDGPERAPLPIGHDGACLGGANAGKERQQLRGSGVQVDDTVNALASPRAARRKHPQQGKPDDDGAATHASFVGPRVSQLLGS
jgi:hypothetical protein